MLVVHNIHKKYGKETVLQGVTFQVAKGSVLGLLGGNGAGKSTLIKILASLMDMDQGKISLYGIPRENAKEYKSQIGYVPQGIALTPQLTVEQNLEFWAAMHNLKGKDLKKAVADASEQAKVEQFLKKKVQDCSGGMARRVNLAAGLINRPSLLLLDEPTAGVDEENRGHLVSSITDLGLKGCIVILVSHYRQELEEACTALVRLEKGVLTPLQKEDGQR